MSKMKKNANISKERLDNISKVISAGERKPAMPRPQTINLKNKYNRKSKRGQLDRNALKAYC